MSLMRTSVLAAPFLAATLLSAQAPNVLLIVMDDIGIDGIGAYNIGTAPAPTPNISALANRGLLFRNAYAQPSCSPTRAALHTGRYAFRTGVNVPGDTLALSETTLPEILPANYARALIGKWHLGSQNANYPNQSGWTHFAGIIGGGVNNYYRWTQTINGQARVVTTYTTTEITNQAVSWIRAQTTPWVASVNFNAPHTPFHAPPASLHSYNLQGLDPQTQPLPFYKASIEAMDREIGRLLTEIGAATVANTNIIILGDNGTATSVLESPYTGRGKGTLQEAGVRVPLIFAGPAVQSPGREASAPVHVVDLFHTIAALTGVDARAAVPAAVALDGVDLVPYLTNPSQPALRTVAYVDQLTGGTRNGAVRDLRYKYLQNAGGNAFYDLQADPYEQQNLLLNPLSPALLTRSLELQTEIKHIQGEAAWFSFGTGCAGAAGVPRLNAVRGSRPVLGRTLSMRIRNFHSSVTQCLGVISIAQINLELTMYGAPSCTLYTDLLSLTALVPTGVRVDWNVPIPAQSSLLGLRFYLQGIVFEPGVNVHDAILTNAGVGLIEAR